MANPVELIGQSSRRIARLAAIRTFLAALGPAITATAIGLLLTRIGDVTWTRYGYSLAPDRANALQLAFMMTGVTVLITGAVMAYLEYRRADDFVATAAELDNRLAGNAQITTLASLANPAAIEAGRLRRTPLFPVLWRRAIMFFEGFDPASEFKLEIGEPLKRSSILAGVVALAMVLGTLGFVRLPTPAQQLAGKLRGLAEEIARTATTAEDSALAESVREAANALENSKLPPQEKKQRIEEAMQQAAKADQKRQNSQSGKDQGTGKSNAQSANGNGKGQSQNQAGGGSGEGQSGTGAGKGEGKSGQGSAKNDHGQGVGKNNQNGKNEKSDNQSVELQKDLAKAEAQVETANANNPGPENKAGEDKNRGNANKPGDNPNQKGGGEPNPNMPGDIPKPGAKGDRNMASGGNPKDNKDRGSNLGDTHLGEIPSAANYQKYLKPGEKGSTLDIKDARYVMFRLPGTPTSGDGGKTVLDTERPRASTAYVNAPLAPSNDNAPPDERQLVPPRYRDMIR